VRRTFRLGSTSLVLLTGWEPALDSHEEVRDPNKVRDLLGRAIRDRLHLGTLRDILAKAGPGFDVSRLTDQQVLQLLMGQVADGKLRLASRPEPRVRLPVIVIPEEPAQPKDPPAKAEEKPEPAVTISIKAEDGTAAPPKAVAPNQSVKLKGVPSTGSGTYQWKTSSKLITLKNDTAQVVTVEAGAKASGGAASELVELTFTPSGKSALSPVSHGLGVAQVTFSSEPAHPWGYDAYGEMKSLDSDNNETKPKPEPKMDFVAVQRNKVGKVKVTLGGAAPADIFFKSTKTAAFLPKVEQPTSASYVLEIDGKDPGEGELEAHLGSTGGPLLAKIGVVVLKELSYKAELFRVKDSKSASTALKQTFTGADVTPKANKYYQLGVAELDVSGGAAEVDIEYDLIKNGALDLEPGKTTDEQKKIMAKCTSTRSRVVYVHDLHWSYYLASDAGKDDTHLTIKNYGTAYLGYIGKKAYRIEDGAGHSATVTVKSVNTSTGRVELTAKIGTDFKASDKAALIWPLGGLSGDPLWVKDVGSVDDLANYIAHELGHQLAGLSDVCEVDNFMHGGSNTGSKLRHRKIAQYYKPTATEEQWKKMTGR